MARRRNTDEIVGDLPIDLPPAVAVNKDKVRVPLRPLWTENKAKLIERYLYFFVLLTKHGSYIDGFAGPQGEPKNWAAKLVLETEPPWLRNFYLFEKDPAKLAALEALRVAHTAGARKVRVFPGDFNKRVSEILSGTGIGAKEAAFCLIDQHTFECRWETLERIAAHKSSGPKIEIFYFLANFWFGRAVKGSKAEGREAIRAWWGRDDWEGLTELHGIDRANLFARRFQDELGYASARPWAIYDREQGRRVMYYMIHATDHGAAPELMARAYEKAVRPKEAITQLALEMGVPLRDDLVDEASHSIPSRLESDHQPLESAHPTA